jgi:CxxC motif-containing protein (DUF1111 family)
MRIELCFSLVLCLPLALAGGGCGNSSGPVDAAPLPADTPAPGADPAAALAAPSGVDPTADPTVTGGSPGASEAATAGPGDPLPGLTGDEQLRFQNGKAEFTSIETVEDGLGPVFNDTSCGNCHTTPAIGGGNALLETRFGTVTGGRFDPLASLGGSLQQVHGIGIAGRCNFVGELVPPEATIRAGRRTTSLLGLGLVDAVPDAAFGLLAALERRLFPGEAGRVGMVRDIAKNRNRPGRFGWKGQNPSLSQFAADAYLNEMGLTSPLFPDENCPQGDCSLLDCNPDPGLNDDGSGPARSTDFMTFLAPPAPGAVNLAVAHGRQVFNVAGCNHCHAGTLVTGNSPSAALRGKAFHPFSDFLLHDMGGLGDGIELGAASGKEFRTAPLWGLHSLSTFLHDGRASSITEAIRAHDGQGRRTRDAFNALSPGDRSDLLKFLGSL